MVFSPKTTLAHRPDWIVARRDSMSIGVNVGQSGLLIAIAPSGTDLGQISPPPSTSRFSIASHPSPRPRNPGTPGTRGHATMFTSLSFLSSLFWASATVLALMGAAVAPRFKGSSHIIASTIVCISILSFRLQTFLASLALAIR